MSDTDDCGLPATFVCTVCNRELEACFTEDDDMPGACDACWCDAHAIAAKFNRVAVNRPATPRSSGLHQAAWRLALFAGYGPWEMCDGTPVDIHAIVRVMLDAARELDGEP
jgi:hypothetical protein